MVLGPIFCALRGGKTKFLNFFYRGIRNKKVCKDGLPENILSKRQKTRKGGAYALLNNMFILMFSNHVSLITRPLYPLLRA